MKNLNNFNQMDPANKRVKLGFKVLARLLSLVLGMLLLLGNYWVKADPPPGSGTWVQTFNEDFKGITMASDKRSFTTNDGNTWITNFYWGNGSIGDGSLNYYTGNNVSCDGENLVMKVTQELAAGQHPFAGGLANTDPTAGGSFSQRYGYYELRVKISMTNGDAPYAGLPPVNHAWPPETEMFETPYAWGQNGQKIHFLNKTSTCDGPAEYDFGTGFHLQDAYHTIGLMWDQNQVIFYVDGVQRGVGPCTPDQNPVFLNIGHGCGSDGGSWNGDAYLGTWPQNVYYDYFKVWSKDGSGTKIFVRPAAPTAISGAGKIGVSWLGSVGATSYNVKRSTSSGSGYSTIATVITPYYTDNNVSNGTTYYYVVTAIKSGTETGNSKEASAMPEAGTGTNGSKLCGYGTVCGEGYSGSSDGYKAFDGDMNSYFDYITPNGAQTGMDIGLGNSALLTRVKFYPRGGFEGRMTGGKFQGSNDNVNFVDLYTISVDPAAGWNEVTVNAGTSYRYFRYLSPAGSYGNVREIEFYGNAGSVSVSVTGVSLSPTTASIGVGATQTLTATVAPSNATNKSVTWSSNNTAIATVSSSGVVTGVAVGSATITVTTVDGTKTATCTITVTTPATGKLTGTAIGTAGSYGSSGNTISMALDGNTTTFFDSPNADASWVGLDLGSAYVITSVRFYPRSGYESRMNGGIFQGSNVADFSTSTNLFTITTNPALQYTTATVSKGSAFRYVRYLSPTGSYGNVAEVEFYGNASSNVAVTGVSVSPTSASITVGTTTQLTATVAPSNATNKAVSWNSSNTAIATVNSSGLVTGVAAGTATITVTTTDGAKTATCAISVPSSGGTEVEITRTGWIASASATGGGAAAYALDGNIGTRFSPGISQASGQWWSVNFGAVIAVTRIQLEYTYWPNDYPRGYAVYISTDGISWGTAIVTGTGSNTAGITSITLPAGTSTRYLKVQLTLAAAGVWYTIGEFRAYNTSGLKSAFASTAPAQLDISAFKVSVFPNPLTEKSVLKIITPDASDINIRITDISGRIVFANKIRVSGESSLPLTLEGLGKGVYILQVQQGNQIVTKRILK